MLKGLTQTGANSGIGFEATKAFLAASASYHVLLACRSKDKADKALTELEALSLKGTFSYLPLDITNEPSIESAYNLVATQFRKLDILINNAGVHIIGSNLNLADQMRQTFSTNTASQAAITETFKPLLKLSPNPKVIFLSSQTNPQ